MPRLLESYLELLKVVVPDSFHSLLYFPPFAPNSLTGGSSAETTLVGTTVLYGCRLDSAKGEAQERTWREEGDWVQVLVGWFLAHWWGFRTLLRPTRSSSSPELLPPCGANSPQPCALPEFLYTPTHPFVQSVCIRASLNVPSSLCSHS